MRQECRDSNSRIVCTVDTVMVGVDMMTGKSREWSEQDIANLGLFLIPVEEEQEAYS